MYIPKRYGQSHVDKCPFCGKQASLENKQGVAVCKDHKNSTLDMKCVCGSWLEIRKGKYGAYGNCIKCGNISLKKVLELTKPEPARPKQNTTRKEAKLERIREMKNKKPAERKEVTIRSDELDLL